MLVPLSFVEKSNLATVMINKQLLFYNATESEALLELASQVSPIISANSSSGLFFLSAF